MINPAKVNAMLPEDATYGGIYKSIIDAAVDLYRGVHDAGLEESRGAVLEFMQARRNEMQIYEDIPGRLQD